MADPLEELAARAQREPLFLGFVLAAFSQIEHLDDGRLAATLGCLAEDLVMLRLCRAPRDDAQGFREDIAAISTRFKLDPVGFAKIVKRGRVVAHFQAARTEPKEQFLAARSPEDPPAEVTP